MPLDSNDDVEGLLFLIATANLTLTLDKKGFNSKIIESNQERRGILYKIALKLNPDGVLEQEAQLNSIFTILSITKLNDNIASLPLNYLTDFNLLLNDIEYLKMIKDLSKSIVSENSISEKINQYTIPFTDAATKATSVLQNINSGNYTELVKPTNILKYIDQANLWTNNTVDSWIKNLPSKEIDKIINDIPILSMVMPNFSSFTSTLNATYLTSQLTPANTFCNPCLVNFLGVSGLKSDIMGFLNTNLSAGNTWLNGHLDKLNKGIEQFQTLASKIKLDLDLFSSLNNSLDSLINSLVSNLIPASAEKCMPVIFLINMLKAFKLGILNLFIKPMTNQLDGLNLSIKQATEFFDSLQALKDLIPQIDC